MKKEKYSEPSDKTINFYITNVMLPCQSIVCMCPDVKTTAGCDNCIDNRNTVKPAQMTKKIKKPPQTITFERTWMDAKNNPPEEGGRYWCIVEEQNDLGLSKFQWNCYYDEANSHWYDDGKTMKVRYYTELGPMI